MLHINRKYRARLFCRIFGDPANKANMLSLYNALCDTDYTDPDDIEVYTLEDPNMPLRGFMYFGRMYDRYITEKRLNIYGSTLIKIPTPKYTIFYNGSVPQKDKVKLRLSDAFIREDSEKDFEWAANLINLNRGYNEDFLEKCRPLRDYMTFVNQVNDNLRRLSIEDSIESAVDYCIAHNVLKSFLLNNKAEDVLLILSEKG